MKKLIILMLFWWVSITMIYAQDLGAFFRTEPATKLESLLNKEGLIVRGFQYVGEIYGASGGMRFIAVKVHELDKEDQVVRGLKIEIVDKNQKKDASFLDLEEAENLSKAIQEMMNMLSKWEGMDTEEYVEIVFSTKGGFAIMVTREGLSRGAFSSIKEYTKCIFSSPKELATAKAIVDKGLKLLNAR